MPKRDKLGLHAAAENACLEALALAIEASFAAKAGKIPFLEKLRVKITVLQNLIRTEHELGIFPEKTYLFLSGQTIEIGKMASGWLAYMNAKGSP